MGWFWELRSAVGGSGFGANPISFSEIKAWSDLTGIILTPWEVSVIKKMDLRYLKISSEIMDKSREKTKRTNR